tara:strand:+ start:495 stop:1046 length:552 start_codon:yes stop_codon:yes gene_type:complete
MKKYLLFLGPPGAGKGTQAGLMSVSNQYLHLSTGELLRKEVDLKTNLGIQVKEIINSGQLVKDELVLEIVRKNLLKKNKGWILDGYPRNISQANSLNQVLEDINQALEMVFYLDVNEDILVKRLLSRGRTDDNEDTIRTRLNIYKETTEPLIDFYKEKKILKYINGDRELKVISDEIKQKMAT